MAYLKIGTHDYSNYTSDLKVTTTTSYASQTNAAGDTVVDYINQKRKIEVTIIPLTDTMMRQLKTDVDAFNVSLSFRNPKTGVLETDVDVIIPSNAIDYYTIQTGKVMYKAVKLTFTEL